VGDQIEEKVLLLRKKEENRRYELKKKSESRPGRFWAHVGKLKGNVIKKENNEVT